MYIPTYTVYCNHPPKNDQDLDVHNTILENDDVNGAFIHLAGQHIVVCIMSSWLVIFNTLDTCS